MRISDWSSDVCSSDLRPSVPVRAHPANRRYENVARAVEKRGTFRRPTLLTDAKVRAAKPSTKPYKVTDANRLYLLVTPSGGKLWRWNYDYDSKQKRLASGAYQHVSPADDRNTRAENGRAP